MSDDKLSPSELSRRAVIQGIAKGAAFAALPTWFVTEARAAEGEAAYQRPRRMGPNDTIHVGVIGTGGPRGGYQQGLNVARSMASKAGVKVVAVCDVDALHREHAAKQFGPETAQYLDYREMLRRRDLDVVVIGTPDHWHATQCLDAMHAGMDVYCEKPLTLTIAEGRAISNAAQKGKRVFQTGSQQRSDGRFRLACELVRNGRIGRLKTVTAHLPAGPTGGPFAPKQVPEGFDWRRWLGPAPEAAYMPERSHGSFRWWRDYSGGMITDWGAHHNDIAQWAMGMDGSGPLSAWAAGKNPPVVDPNAYDTFPEFDVHYDYPGGVILRCTNQGENGVTFDGENGWIFVTRGRIGASDPKLLEEPLSASGTRLEVSNDHVQNFLDRVRDRKGQPICSAEVGHRSVSVCHLANIALSLGGRKLRWDARAERFLGAGSDEANRMLQRPPQR